MNNSRKKNNTVDVLGFSVNTSLLRINMDKEKLLINTLNPHCYYATKYDEYYKESLLKSDILIPDGIGIVWSAKVLQNEKIKRIAGADLHKYLLKKLQQRGGKVFYMGAAPSTLQKIELRLKKEYPNVQFKGYSPPYKPKFTAEDNAEIIRTINAFKPDVVFVGMTAPKQEKWSYQHKEILDTKIIASVGAVFDFYADTVKRPGKYWQKYGFEWLPRFLREPKRLWRRNIISNPTFVWDVHKAYGAARINHHTKQFNRFRNRMKFK